MGKANESGTKCEKSKAEFDTECGRDRNTKSTGNEASSRMVRLVLCFCAYPLAKERDALGDLRYFGLAGLGPTGDRARGFR
jgi:hypothetical protein